MLTVKFDDKDFCLTLSKLLSQIERPQSTFGVLGETLIKIHAERFKAQVDPQDKPWQPLSPLTLAIKRKQGHSDKILRQRGYLADRLFYNIKSNGLEFGTDRPYAITQQFGATIKPRRAKRLAFNGHFAKQVKIPARPFLGVSKDDQEAIFQLVKKRLLSQIK